MIFSACRVVYNIFENFPVVPSPGKNKEAELNNHAFITLANRKVDRGRVEIKTYYDQCYDLIVSKLKEVKDFEENTKYSIHDNTVMTKENANTMKMQTEINLDAHKAASN